MDLREVELGAIPQGIPTSVNGVMWYGMVWYGMVWHGLVWVPSGGDGLKCSTTPRVGK